MPAGVRNSLIFSVFFPVEGYCWPGSCNDTHKLRGTKDVPARLSVAGGSALVPPCFGREVSRR